jgi:alpha-L-rhamnosidase
VLTALLSVGAAILPAIPAAAREPSSTTNVSQQAQAAADAPTGLKVNGLDRPADLEDLASPTFSWQLRSLPQQSAYRVLVSSTAAGTGDVWDSGKVASAQQTDVAYGGPALSGSQRYSWTVQVWDGADEATEWAAPSWFGTSPGATWDDATPIWAPSATAGWTDYTYSAKLTITAVAVGLRFRVNGTNSYMWQFRGGDNRLVPHKQTNGTYATLGSAVNLPAGTLAVGTQATVSIQVAGSTITTRINGVQVDQRTDASYAGGIVGVRTGNTETGLLDDVSVVSSSGATLLSEDFGAANSFACGTVSGGALSVPTASNCGLAGYGNDWAMFRKDVEVADKEIAWATLFATGTEWKASKQYTFKASVDGTFVGLGPTAPVGTETRFDGFDVTSLLTRGTTSTVSIIANSSSANARVLAQLQIQYADGTRDVIGSGADWQALSAGTVYPSPGSYGTSYFAAPRENLDARRFPVGFDKPGFDATGWVAAEERSAIADLQAAPMAKVEQQYRTAAKVTDLADGSQVVDFGRTWMGGIAWDLAAGVAGQQVQVRFGQVLNPDGSVKWQTSATSNYLDTPTLRDGAQHLETWGMRTFRYVQVVGSPEPVTTASLKAVALVYPFDEEASAFASSNDNLDQVYALSKNTIEATNLNFYTDSWERERTDYEADAYLQLQSSLYLMDDLSLGRYSMNYFKTNRTWPTEWPAYVVLAVHDAWRQTGSTEQVADYYENLKTKLPSKWLEQSTGLVRKTTGVGCSSSTDCDIVDWPTSERDGYVFGQYNTVINSITYRTLVDMSEMAAAIGKDDEASSYADQAAALRDAINAKFYNPATGSYDDGANASGVLTGHASVHASAFALAFGVPADDQKTNVASYVKSRGMACSVYCAAFLIKGLYDGGDGQTALDLMTADGTRSWMNMIKVGAGATMEAWDISLKSNVSYSHPWAASPAFNVPSGLFGIQPVTAGYETVAIKPQPGDLQWGTIKTPTVRGSVGAAFAQDASGTTVVASVPGNTKSVVGVPTKATAPTTLYVDGAARTVTPQDGRFDVALGAGCHVLAPTADVADLARLTSVCSVEPTVGRNLTAAVSADGGRGWSGAGAALTLTPIGEDAGTAVAEYRVDEGDWTPYTTPVVLDEGVYDIAWRLRDDDEVVAEGTVPVQVDATAPTVSADVADRRVTLTAADAASGVWSAEYRVDEDGWRAYSAVLELDGRAHVVAFRATDKAGNTSALEQVTLVATVPAATAAPRVTGTARYGERLAATPGTWDAEVTTALQWLRDGSPAAGATGPSYRLGAADVGARISVRVMATGAGRPVGTATSAPSATVAKAASRTTVKVAPKQVRRGKKVSVVVTVTGAGANAVGRVRVTVAGRTITKALRHGRLKLRVKATGRGSTKVKVRYLGSDVLGASTATGKYRVR